MRRKISKEEEVVICNQYNAFIPLREIASNANIGSATLMRILNRNNIKLRNRKRLTKEQKDKVIELYKLGTVSIKEIIKLSGVKSEQTIYKILDDNNIPRMKEKGRLKEVQVKEEYTVKLDKDVSMYINSYKGSVDFLINKLIRAKIKRNNWTDDDIKFLKNNYPTMGINKLSKKLNMKPTAIRQKVYSLKLKKETTWTDSNIEFLKNNYPTMDTKIISEKLNISNNAIHTKSHFLKLAKDTSAIDSMRNYIKENYNNMTTREIARSLGVSMQTVMRHAKMINLPAKRTIKKWEDSEVEYIKENYNKKAVSAIAYELKRSEANVRYLMRCLNLKSRNTPKPFPPNQLDYIKDNYKIESISKMALKLKISYYRVKIAFKLLGIEQ